MLIGSIVNPILAGAPKPQEPLNAPQQPEPPKVKDKANDASEAAKFSFTEEALKAAENAASEVNRAAEVAAANAAAAAAAASASRGGTTGGATAPDEAATATRSPVLYQQEPLFARDEDAIRAWAEKMQSREQMSKLVVLTAAKPADAANLPGAPSVAKFIAGDAAMASAPALPKTLATA